MRQGGRTVTYGRIPRGPFRVTKTFLGGTESSTSISTIQHIDTYSRPNQKDTSLTKESSVKKKYLVHTSGETSHTVDINARKEKLTRETGTQTFLGTKYLGAENWLGASKGSKVKSEDVPRTNSVVSYMITNESITLEILTRKTILHSAQTDTAEIKDAIVKELIRHRSIEEISHSTIAITRLLSMARIPIEFSTTSDSFRIFSFSLHLKETLSSIETIGLGGSGFQFITETSLSHDVTTKQRILHRAGEDLSESNSEITYKFIALRLVSETAHSADNPLRILSLIKKIAETSTSKDAFKQNITTPRLVSTLAETNDSLIEKTRFMRAVNDLALNMDSTFKIHTYFFLPFENAKTIVSGKVIFTGERNTFDVSLIHDKSTIQSNFSWETEKFDYVYLPYSFKTSNITFSGGNKPFVVVNNLLPYPRLVFVSIVQKINSEE
jgi:hypothetical protein